VDKKKDVDQENVKTWEEYIKNPSDIYDKEKKNSKHNSRRERFKFDLHGFTLDNANRKIREIIFFCKEKKYKELLIITGKGIHSTNDNDVYVSKNLGKLKYSVPEFIKSDEELNKLILSVTEADIKDGGEGALLIKMKNL
jgi:DNA-nicking Smr family endonuclease